MKLRHQTLSLPSWTRSIDTPNRLVKASLSITTVKTKRWGESGDESMTVYHPIGWICHETEKLPSLDCSEPKGENYNHIIASYIFSKKEVKLFSAHHHNIYQLNFEIHSEISKLKFVEIKQNYHSYIVQKLKSQNKFSK